MRASILQLTLRHGRGELLGRREIEPLRSSNHLQQTMAGDWNSAREHDLRIPTAAAGRFSRRHTSPQAPRSRRRRRGALR